MSDGKCRGKYSCYKLTIWAKVKKKKSLRKDVLIIYCRQDCIPEAGHPLLLWASAAAPCLGLPHPALNATLPLTS